MSQARPPRADALLGIQFPIGADGRRRTTGTGIDLIARALAPVDAGAAAAVRAESRWRQRYPTHFRAVIAAQLRDRETCLAVASAGLAAARAGFEFVRADGATSLAEAMARPSAQPFTTVEIRGRGDAAPRPWEIPYRGRSLSGDALLRQLDDWQTRGIIEPGCAQALRRAAAHPEWFDLSDRRIALLGAGSEAGPLGWLAHWRATLFAVDLPSPAVWTRIRQTVEAGNATLYAPQRVRDAQPASIGADLLAETPDIARWLIDTAGTPLDLAALAYAHGEKHLRIALAMDALMTHVLERQPGSTLMAMATPTDVFAVPAEIADAARQRRRGPIERAFAPLLRAATGAHAFDTNGTDRVHAADGRAYGLIDALVLQQGPNYALAKRLQHWRLMLAESEGHAVSLNVAPSTTTASVTANPALKAAFAGAAMFDVEAFAPETTHALMAALWVHDLRCDAARHYGRVQPLDRLWTAAAHGGLWRAAYRPRSVLPLAAGVGWLRDR